MMMDEARGPRGAEALPDGTFVLDSPVTLPEVLDIVIVGGGPFGTAAAFRAKELGLAALVIDYDDLMKRIRDYAKDKRILPDYGGGDKMQFPKGGELVEKLHFPPIDKDAMCAEWKALYRRYNVPAQVGVEMTGLEEAEAGVWRVAAWNHKTKSAQSFLAKHVVLAYGRGVPRRLDVPGKAEGLAFGLSDASKFLGEPVCVIGGGTSAAEAVIAISEAKCQGSDSSGVYWSYRGEKMPKVSRALADGFFQAYVVNGNVRYLPKSEPVSVVEIDDQSYLAIRTERLQMEGRPAETTQLEFAKTYCIACIGEDIPEALLNSIGIPLVTGGPSNKKRILVSPLLETRQPNVYLAGDILSPAYFEAADVDVDPSQYAEVKRRGNIKSALRDGVFVTEVIAQKLAGRTQINVQLEFEDAAIAPPGLEEGPTRLVPSAAAAPPTGERSEAQAYLVSILATGVEANEFNLRENGATTIGRQAADICFPEDSLLSDRHATIGHGSHGYSVRDEGSAQGVFLEPAEDRAIPLNPGAILKVGQQWLVCAKESTGLAVLHYDNSGRPAGRFVLKEGTSVVGRDAPDWTLDASDATLSRRHLALTLKDGRVSARDLKSANGILLKVDRPVALENGDRLRLGQQVLKFTWGAQTRPAEVVEFDTQFHSPASVRVPVVATATEAPPAAAAAPAGLAVTFANLGRTAPCTKGQTLCEVAESAGIHLEADCHQGVCGMDPVRVVSGEEHLNTPGDTERSTLEDLCSLAPGAHRLACMARVNGPVVVEILKS